MEQYLHCRGPQQTKGMRMLVCRACLTSEVALHNIYTNGLSETLANIIGVPIQSTDDMPPYICDVCVHLLRKFERYRAMCRRAMQILQRLQLDDESETHQICNNQQQEFLNFKPTVTKIISFKPERPLRFSQKINIDIFGNEASEIKNSISYTFNPDDDKSNAVFVDKDCGLDAVGQIPNETNSENNVEEFKEIKALDNIVMIISDDEMTADGEVITVKPERIVKKRKIKTEDEDTKAKVKNETSQEMIEIYDIIELAQVNMCEDKRVRNNIKMEKRDLNGIDCKSVVKPRVLRVKPKRPVRNYDITSDGAFARKNNVEVKCLTKKEQKQEMEALKKKYEHLPYQCQMCYRGYSQQQTFARHMLSHDPVSGDFACDICGLRWKTSRLRNRHRTTRHKYIFICKVCGKKNYSHATTSQHFLSAHSPKAIKCEICDKAFKKAGNYADHIRNTHRKNSLACQICRKGFTGSRGVKMHMHLQHKQAKQCSSCNKYFENKAALAKHLENSINGACAPDMSPCFTCGEGFKTEDEATEHSYQHVAERSACSKCNKLMPSTQLSRHWKTQHSGVPKPRKKHSVPIPTQASNVQRKSLICETCGKAFQFVANLSMHRLLHTGEKPHRCTYCPKTFRLKNALNNHLLVHTDERPYHCEFCPKAFRQAAHLIGHIRIHTLEKPFECEVCHKTFNLKANMRIHVKTVHEGMPPRRKKRNK